MVGLSGGGWTTTLASAIIPDIKLSIPIAGSIPKWPTEYYDKWVPDLPEGRNQAAKAGNPFDPHLSEAVVTLSKCKRGPHTMF